MKNKSSKITKIWRRVELVSASQGHGATKISSGWQPFRIFK